MLHESPPFYLRKAVPTPMSGMIEPTRFLRFCQGLHIKTPGKTRLPGVR
jgi:hypothetical protein